MRSSSYGCFQSVRPHFGAQCCATLVQSDLRTAPMNSPAVFNLPLGQLLTRARWTYVAAFLPGLFFGICILLADPPLFHSLIFRARLSLGRNPPGCQRCRPGFVRTDEVLVRSHARETGTSADGGSKGGRARRGLGNMDSNEPKCSPGPWRRAASTLSQAGRGLCARWRRPMSHFPPFLRITG